MPTEISDPVLVPPITLNSVSWVEVTGKPATFPAAAHNHVQGDVTGLAASLAGKANISHGHAQSDVTGLEAAIAGKAAAVHTHAQSDVTGLTVALGNKADSVHSHPQSQVTGLMDSLDGKASLVHSHATSDVTDLDESLAGKAAVAHSHETSDVTGLDESLAGKAAVAHSHVTSDVTGLIESLAGKAAVAHGHVIGDVTGLEDALESGGGGGGGGPVAWDDITGKPELVLGPLQLSARPEDSTYMVDSPGVSPNGRIRVVQLDGGAPIKLVISVAGGTNPTPGGSSYNSGTRVISYSLGHNGSGVHTATASQLVSSAPVGPPGAYTIGLYPGGDGSAVVSLMALTEATPQGGTAAEKGQEAHYPGGVSTCVSDGAPYIWFHHADAENVMSP